jgi:hypothetical protein
MGADPADVRLLLVLGRLWDGRSRNSRPAVAGRTRRDFFGDRLATLDELRAAEARTTTVEHGAAAPARRHVA